MGHVVALGDNSAEKAQTLRSCSSSDLRPCSSCGTIDSTAYYHSNERQQYCRFVCRISTSGKECNTYILRYLKKQL